jgi:hypothetical protein
MVPVVAPVGTATINFVVVAELGVAAVVPLNLTELLAAVLLKFVPLIVTDAPIAPDVGEKLVIVGAAANAMEHPKPKNRRIPVQSHRAHCLTKAP